MELIVNVSYPDNVLCDLKGKEKKKKSTGPKTKSKITFFWVVFRGH